MQKRTKRPRKIKASSIIFPGRIMIPSYCEKDFCASTALHKQGIRSDWKSDLLGSEPPTSCRYSNTGIKKEIAPRNSSNFLKLEHLYVLPTQLGRCQSLDIRWMVCFLKTKERQSHISLAKCNEFLLQTDLLRWASHDDIASIQPQSWSLSWQSSKLF